MRCLTPISVKNPRPHLYKDTQYILVPCGKCEACVKRKSLDWFVRLEQERQTSGFVWFITLTYSDDNLPFRIADGKVYNDVCKKDVIDFHKRLRKALGKDSRDYKYFMCAEYGGKFQRPHYHEISYNIHPNKLSLISDAWHNGFVKIEPVTEGRMKYVTGYTLEKLFVPDGCLPVFNLISKHFGESYVSKMKDFHDSPSKVFVPYLGSKLPMPRYYRERLFTSAQLATRSKELEEEAQKCVDEYLKTHSIREMEEYNQQIRANYVREVRERRKHSKSKF